jgi:hypothetical protein
MVDAITYIVDCADRDRIAESKKELDVSSKDITLLHLPLMRQAELITGVIVQPRPSKDPISDFRQQN